MSDSGRGEQSLFTVRDVARIFDLKESRLRYWAQTGFINPSGSRGRSYTFSDLIEIRAASELLQGGIPLQRVRKHLQALRKALPEEPQPLQRLRVQSDGDSLVVTEEKTTFNPVSGQLLIDFEIDELEHHAAEVLDLAESVARRRAKTEGGQIRATEPSSLSTDLSADPSANPEASDDEAPETAYGWFLLGCSIDAEDDRFEDAVSAYQQALELDPSLAAAQTNLGNLYYRRGQRSNALRCYEGACAIDPDQSEARYNLANIYEEEGDLDLAIAEYHQALRGAPDFADVHFNLALALERVGGRAQAITHWRRFLELNVQSGEYGGDDWCDIAREHLSQLERRSNVSEPTQ